MVKQSFMVRLLSATSSHAQWLPCVETIIHWYWLQLDTKHNAFGHKFLQPRCNTVFLFRRVCTSTALGIVDWYPGPTNSQTLTHTQTLTPTQSPTHMAVASTATRKTHFLYNKFLLPLLWLDSHIKYLIIACSGGRARANAFTGANSINLLFIYQFQAPP